MQNKKKYYVTTPIYYGTARPHLGSLYSTVIADVLARWEFLRGKQVMFLTGTDEHGQKIELAAKHAGMAPKAFVDKFVGAYKDTWKRYHIAYTRFIRTTDTDHVQAVQHWLLQLIDSDDIYKGAYQGWYCTPCESFVTQDNTQAAEPVPCPDCSRATTWLSEETYFFRLSAYQDRLLAFYKKQPEFIVPKERYAEVIRFVESGLRDLSISRTTVSWGIPFPGDNQHVTYVWADALNNYITAIGYADPSKSDEFNYWWPADTQVMGKDIVRFHAVYWPAFLMATGLEPPQRLLVHGWIRVGEEKMSKSKGNVVDPLVLQEACGADAVRYYLMRKLAITQDSPFTRADLQQTVNADLANDLGNLLNRVLKLADKYSITTVVPPEAWDLAAMELRSAGWQAAEAMQLYMESYEIHMALARLWKYVHTVNKYIHEQQPWKQALKDPEAFRQTISAACHALRSIALLAWPIMPHKMNELLAALGQVVPEGHNVIEDVQIDNWGRTFVLHQREPLFTRIEMEEAQVDQTEKENAAKPNKPSYIGIDDLVKVELEVGTIVDCKPVEGSSKLLQLTVRLGNGQERTILSGIAKTYQPDELIGKQGTFVVNLKPRKMMGILSHGMMLMVQDDQGHPRILSPDKPVLDGTRLS